MPAPITTVSIRPDRPGDEAKIMRLAALDSAAVPPAPFLLAEVEGELLAALSLGNGRSIADPFHPTLRIVAMLQAFAATAAPERTRGRARGYHGSARLALGH